MVKRGVREAFFSPLFRVRRSGGAASLGRVWRPGGRVGPAHVSDCRVYCLVVVSWSCRVARASGRRARVVCARRETDIHGRAVYAAPCERIAGPGKDKNCRSVGRTPSNNFSIPTPTCARASLTIYTSQQRAGSYPPQASGSLFALSLAT